MRRFVDLHTHSTASDGELSPAALIACAERKRLAAVALTDHDTTAGLAEARAGAAATPDLHFVPGVEVSARPPSGTLHILGLGIDPAAEAVQRLAGFLRGARDERNPKIVAKLRALGVGVTMDDVEAAAAARGGGSPGPRVVGRMHIAEALRRRGAAKSIDGAFRRYLARGADAYVERERLPAGQTIELLRAGGGVAVLAHPVQLACDNRAQLERIVRSLMRAGLQGIEVYHSDHSAAQTRAYLDLARRHGLFVTGGSDFHGRAKAAVKLGRPRVPLAALDAALRERLGLP